MLSATSAALRLCVRLAGSDAVISLYNQPHYLITTIFFKYILHILYIPVYIFPNSSS